MPSSQILYRKEFIRNDELYIVELIKHYVDFMLIVTFCLKITNTESTKYSQGHIVILTKHLDFKYSNFQIFSIKKLLKIIAKLTFRCFISLQMSNTLCVPNVLWRIAFLRFSLNLYKTLWS